MSLHNEDNLVWTVLDAPKILPKDWDLFWSAWNKHAGASYIDKKDPEGNRDGEYDKTGKRTEFFTGLNIYAKDKSHIEDGYWKVPFLDYKEIFPNVLDDLAEAFPWADVEMCRLWMSNMPIPYHRDFTMEPGALRAMIYNENDKPTFKVFHPRAGVHYINSPQETNTFIYNNSTCLHGSDRTDGVNKIVLLVIHKTKNKDALNEHLERSAAKYPENCKYLDQ